MGVVRDIKHDTLDVDGVPHIYLPIYQFPGRVMNLVLRTSLSPSLLEPQIRREVQSVDPGLPVFNVTSMGDIINLSLAPRRFSAELVEMFAGLALLLAAIGTYGLLAYMVGQRSREIGIRMALGARRLDVIKLVLGAGVTLAGIGVVVGILLAAFGSPLIAGLLYGVRPMDPAVFLVVPIVLLAVAFMASYIPARRAARIDPMIALREG